jgi:transposase
MSYEAIAEHLKVRRDRISRRLRIYATLGQILDPRRTDCSPKLTDEIQDFVEVRTIQIARLSRLRLAQEITEKFDVTVNPSMINRKRIRLSRSDWPFFRGIPKSTWR